MRTIEITTTQHVTIEYELASLRDRVFAWLLDMMVLWGGVLLMALLIWGVFRFEETGLTLFQYFVVLPAFLFYTPLSETLMNGQTVGKRALGVKVVKLNGKAPTITDYLVRWAFRFADIYLTAGAIASLLIGSGNRAQRLGDLAANTTLIKVRFDLSFRLDDIQQIGTAQANYTPAFPAVRQLSEADMLTIKTVLMRYQRYPNAAHRRVVRDLCARLTPLLELDTPPRDQVGFLRTLMRDYIMLTR